MSLVVGVDDRLVYGDGRHHNSNPLVPRHVKDSIRSQKRNTAQNLECKHTTSDGFEGYGRTPEQARRNAEKIRARELRKQERERLKQHVM